MPARHDRQAETRPSFRRTGCSSRATMASASCTPSTMGLRLRTGILAVMAISRADEQGVACFYASSMPVGTASAFRLRQCPVRAGCCAGRPMKIAIPDLISNSYFPVIAAVGTGLLQAGRPRCRARARGSGRERACGSQGRQPRVSRLFVASCRRRVSGVAWREASLRAVAGHVLVSGHALGPQRRPRRPQRA